MKRSTAAGGEEAQGIIPAGEGDTSQAGLPRPSKPSTIFQTKAEETPRIQGIPESTCSNCGYPFTAPFLADVSSGMERHCPRCLVVVPASGS